MKMYEFVVKNTLNIVKVKLKSIGNEDVSQRFQVMKPQKFSYLVLFLTFPYMIDV